ncbi:MAG: hypothetical protein QHC90_22830 [Shinella sp.]|nr:hypothetical protein [Shinella sp.]
MVSTEEFEAALRVTMMFAGLSPARVEQHVSLLFRLRDERVVPDIDRKTLENVREWALRTARDYGARTVREAFALIYRQPAVDKDRLYDSGWERAWSRCLPDGSSGFRRGKRELIVQPAH